MKRAVLTGAGQYGRGVIGFLLEKAGYHVVFSDVNAAVVDDINRRKEYTVRRIGAEDSTYTVRNISAMLSNAPELIGEYASCDMICTSVGLTALEKVAPSIADGIRLRAAQGKKEYLNILACENGVGGSTRLKNCILSHLDEKSAAYLEEYIGFPDCAIDGIIPPVKNSFPADVVTETYYEWDALKSAFKGEIPQIDGLHAVDDLRPFLERKFFILNGPNAVTGALGWSKGYQTVQESLADGEIYETVWEMMREAGEMLCIRHGFPKEEMLRYRTFIMDRFLNPKVIDYNSRVAREPIRKLAENDRIVYAMNLCRESEVETPAYYKGIAAVLRYDNPQDAQSAELQKQIRACGVRKTLENVSGIRADSEAADEIEREYLLMKQN